MDLTVQHLRSFLAVAEELHFTRAAARLHVAPPSLSQQVALLEKRLGTALFWRTSRHVELTEAGRELLPLARRAVGALDEVQSWAVRRASGDRVVVGLVVGGPLCSAVVACSAGRSAGVTWDVRSLGFAEGEAAVRSGRVDVALVPAAHDPAVAGLRAVPLWREDRVLVVAATHRLAGRDGVSVAETSDERFVGVAGRPVALDAWFVSPRPDGRRPTVDPVAGTLEEVLNLCAAGLAVNIAGASVARTHPRPDLRFVPLVDVPPVTVHLVSRDGRRSPAQALLEQVAHELVAARAQEFGVLPVL
ncbi:LysR family transcriptional regulator [Kineococcus sp. LSe6-4]|uniref:LysR family transcriptional regulator n=1 Tax=Kineococcus halophytocola TaxID=3234027 RepID=A0ABV4GVW5_9ACTN